MGNIADKASNSLKLRFKRLGSHIVPCGTFICGSLRHQQKIKSMTFKPCFTDTRFVWTPHYYLRAVRFVYGQFALSLEERKPLHFLSIQPALYGDLVNYGPLSVRINEI